MECFAYWLLMRFIAMALFILAACGGSDDDEPIGKERACELLRDHLVELRITAGDGFDVAAHRDAMKQALGPEFVTSCTSSMTDDQVMCGLRAVETGAAIACATAVPKTSR